MRSGERLEGRVLSAGTRHVLLDLPGGPRFVDRASIARVTDGNGSPLDLATREGRGAEVVGLLVTQFNQDRIRIQRGAESIEPTTLGADRAVEGAFVRSGDELKTGPFGRVKLVLPGGVSLSANDDAVVRFTDGGPELVRGKVRLEGGDVALVLPEARVTGRGVTVNADHTRDRSQLSCFNQTCQVEGEGFRFDLHRNHTVTLAKGAGERAPYVAANGANSFPVDLKVGSKSIQIAPGEKCCLVVIESERAAAASGPVADRGPDRAGPDRAGPDRAGPDRARGESGSRGIGRVAKADGPFWHIRSAQQQWKIAPERAATVVLRAGDEVATEDGRLTLAFDDSGSVELNRDSALVIYPEDAQAPGVLSLKRGEARVSAEGKIALVVPSGEVAVEGDAIVRATGALLAVRTEKGRASLTSGRDVRADVPQGTTLVVTRSDGRTKLEASGSGSAPLRLATVEASLAARHAVEVARDDDGALGITFWNNARLILEGFLKARVDESDTGLAATLSDGRIVLLEPGKTVRARPLPREDERPLVAADPKTGPPVALGPGPRVPDAGPAPDPRPIFEPARPEPTRPPVAVAPSADRAPRETAPPPAPRVAAATETRTLPNGAVVTLVNWGPLKSKAPIGDLVEVEGPGGSPVLIGPRQRLTLTRRRGSASLATDDKRVLTWSEGEQTVTYSCRLGADGQLSLELPGERSILVDAGSRFEIELRSDGLVHAMIVGNSYFLRSGEHALVTPQGGLKEMPKDMARTGGR